MWFCKFRFDADYWVSHLVWHASVIKVFASLPIPLRTVRQWEVIFIRLVSAYQIGWGKWLWEMLMVQKLFRILEHNLPNYLVIIVERMTSLGCCVRTSITFCKIFKFGCCWLHKPCSCLVSSWACVATFLRAFSAATTTIVTLRTESFFDRSQHLWTKSIRLLRFRYQIPNNCIQVVDLLLKVWKIDCNVLTLTWNHLLKMVKHLSIAIVNWLSNEVLNFLHNWLRYTGFNLTQEYLLLNWILLSLRALLDRFQILELSLHFFHLAYDPRKSQILTTFFIFRHHHDVFNDLKLFIQVSVS